MSIFAELFGVFMSEQIEHKGVILSINTSKAIVKIERKSACSGCHAQSACSAADKEDREIEVVLPHSDFSIGEEILVTGNYSMGLKAVLFAFVIPFLLMLISLFVSKGYVTDAFAGVISLVVLSVYYIILSFFKDQLKRRFLFIAKKL